jgi:acyl dehydratase
VSKRSEAAYERYLADMGEVSGPGEWFTVDQDVIDRFAEATLDFAAIHVDPVAAARGPFGETIAHGLLTLSMVPHLTLPIMDTPERRGVISGGANYGFNKIRFVSPVRVGRRIRSTVTLTGVELKGDQIEIAREVVVEVEGEERPALIAEWLIRAFY